MRCGAQRYWAEFYLDHEKKRKIVTARTPAEARKILRAKYGEAIQITSVMKK